eukprot:6332460-Pyramimonas_sp.AAC.1
MDCGTSPNKHMFVWGCSGEASSSSPAIYARYSRSMLKSEQPLLQGAHVAPGRQASATDILTTDQSDTAHRHCGYILTTDQSDAGSVGIFLRWTTQACFRARAGHLLWGGAPRSEQPTSGALSPPLPA